MGEKKFWKSIKVFKTAVCRWLKANLSKWIKIRFKENLLQNLNKAEKEFSFTLEMMEGT